VKARSSDPTFLDALVREKRVIVCCGAGGVGKTTTAAALAIAGAQAGRRSVVLTIDPARRLAEAMGLSPEQCRRPVAVPSERLRDAGVEGNGALYAWMLSPRDVVEDVVRRLSENEEQVARILSNRLYQHFSEMVIGLQEYTSGEALHMVTAHRDYDLVILDTPPSRNALDFLDAPRKLTVLLDEKVIGLFLPPKDPPRFWGGVVKLIQKVFTGVFGRSFFHELQEFLESVSHMFHQIRAHAEEVRTMLTSTEAAFVLVTSADPAALAEAEFFRTKLADLQLPLCGYVLNRSWAFTRGLVQPADILLAVDAPAPLRTGHEKLSRLAAAEWQWAQRDRELLAGLRARSPGGQAIATPHIGDAIESLEGLARLAENLVLPSTGRWEHERDASA
jgi:anion-transporting  ArsA/GET3 family ATPase